MGMMRLQDIPNDKEFVKKMVERLALYIETDESGEQDAKRSLIFLKSDFDVKLELLEKTNDSV